MITPNPTNDNPTDSSEKFAFRIGGMHCAACAATIERTCKGLPGVQSASINFAMGSGEVTVAANGPRPAEIQTLVQSLGYTATPLQPESSSEIDSSIEEASDETTVESKRWWWRFIVAGIASGILIALHLAGHGTGLMVLGIVIATIAQIVVGLPFVVSALKQLRHRIVSMDALVGIATSAAYLAGISSLFLGHSKHRMELMDGAMILAFISLGKYLELKARARASSAAQALLTLLPDTSTVERDDGRIETIPTCQIVPGDRVLLAAGQRVPVDGTVLVGTADVTEAMLSGEPLPITKHVGDTLFAGSVLGDAALTMRHPVGGGNLAGQNGGTSQTPAADQNGLPSIGRSGSCPVCASGAGNRAGNICVLDLAHAGRCGRGGASCSGRTGCGMPLCTGAGYAGCCACGFWQRGRSRHPIQRCGSH